MRHVVYMADHGQTNGVELWNCSPKVPPISLSLPLAEPTAYCSGSIAISASKSALHSSGTSIAPAHALPWAFLYPGQTTFAALQRMKLCSLSRTASMSFPYEKRSGWPAGMS